MQLGQPPRRSAGPDPGTEDGFVKGLIHRTLQAALLWPVNTQHLADVKA